MTEKIDLYNASEEQIKSLLDTEAPEVAEDAADDDLGVEELELFELDEDDGPELDDNHKLILKDSVEFIDPDDDDDDSADDFEFSDEVSTRQLDNESVDEENSNSDVELSERNSADLDDVSLNTNNDDNDDDNDDISVGYSSSDSDITEEDVLDDVPEDWAKHTPGSVQADNALKQSMLANLAATMAEIENTDAAKLQSMIVVYDVQDEHNDRPTYMRSTGQAIPSMNLATVFLKAKGHHLIDAQPTSDLSPRDLEKGLGMGLVKAIIDAYDLVDNDLDLNNLKEPYEEAIKFNETTDTPDTAD